MFNKFSTANQYSKKGLKFQVFTSEKMIGAKANVLPLFIRGTVVKGFGRGSKGLGF